MKQPYTLEDINENDFNAKVETMINAIKEVKDIIVCDDSEEECSDECPLKIICKEMNHITMWSMLRKILPNM